MLTLPETPGHPYRGVLAGPHLSRPCRFLVPPPFESLSLTLAGSGRVFVTGAGVTNNLILPPFLRLSNSMLAVFHTIHSRAKKEKRTKKERMLLLLLLKLILNSIGVTIREGVKELMERLEHVPLRTRGDFRGVAGNPHQVLIQQCLPPQVSLEKKG